MASRTPGVLLNGKYPLPLRQLFWPLYRGCTAIPVLLDVPSQRWKDLQAVLKYKGNTLTWHAPINAEDPDAKDEQVISDIYCERSSARTLQETHTALYDSRYLLSKFVNPFDFNTLLDGGGYQQGTAVSANEKATVGFAVGLIGTFVGHPIDAGRFKDIELPDGLRLAGEMMPAALDAILDSVGLDFTVTTKGAWQLASRLDSDSARLPNLDDLHWRGDALPPFVLPLVSVLSRPKTIKCPYKQRIEITVKNGDNRPADRTTATRTERQAQIAALAYQLRQVFHVDGKYLTLAELNTYAGEIFSEADIAAAFMRRQVDNGPLKTIESGQGTPTQKADEAIAAARARFVWAVIHRDWRRLFKLYLPDNVREGTWSDLNFGTITSDGSVEQQAVKDGVLVNGAVSCDWSDFFAAPRRDSVSGQVHIGSRFSQNNAFGRSPFQVKWEDEPLRIVRLVGVGTDYEDGDFSIPGQVFNHAELKVNTIAVNGLGGANSVLISTREQVFFQNTFKIEISLVATLNAPNDETRWHTVDVDSGLKNATGDPLWLQPPDNVTANFDVNNYSTPANADELDIESKRRANIVAGRFNSNREGIGEAHGLGMLRRYDAPDGAIEKIEVCWGSVGPSTVTCKMYVANVGNEKERERKAAVRRANNTVITHGKKAVAAA